MASELSFSGDAIGSGVNATGTVSGSINTSDTGVITADVTVATSKDGSSTFVVTPGGTTTTPGPGGTATASTVNEPNGPNTFGIVLSIPGASPGTVSSLIEFDYTGMDPTTFDDVFFQPSDYNGSNAYTAPDSFAAIPNAPVTATTVVCFASSTLIRTIQGEVAVEELAIGDFVVTASGGHRLIRWLGQHTFNCRRQLRKQEVWPVRIAAHAFGENRPARDLYLSPGHPVLVDADDDGQGGHLVPIMCLINGTSIERVPVDTVTYWHVELDQHDILLAEGLPAESYLDWGDRAFFTEGSDHALHNPDFVVPGLSGRCRPVAIDGPVVEAERRRLDALFEMKLTAQCTWPTDDYALPI